MKRSIGIVVLAGALSGAFLLGRVQAQDEAKPNPMGDMAAWMELGKPGPEQAELEKMAGDWTVTVKELGPGGAAKESTAKTKFSMVLGGLIQRQDYEGNMGGMPFTSIGFTGFNKATGKYESIWMDSMSSGIMYMNGTEKEKNKAYEYKGHFFGPGGTKVSMRTILKHVDADTQTFEMWMDMGQGENKSMEMTYKRVK